MKNALSSGAEADSAPPFAELSTVMLGLPVPLTAVPLNSTGTWTGLPAPSTVTTCA